LGSHAVVLCFLTVVRRRILRRDFTALCTAAEQAGRFFRTPGIDRILAAALLTILAALTVIAALAEPAIVDAVMYHLPRIGHWLQDGKIQILGTTEPRMNYVAAIPEIMMAWLLGSTREGFKLVVVAQAIGGIMTVGATIGLARQSGLSRPAALLAGGLLLGMANVVSQFTAAQTDLFTAGVFAVSFYLWLAALRRGEASVLGAMGAGLALGAKGTVFYLAPTACLWVCWLAWHHRPSWVQWRQTLLAAVAGITIFAVPGLVRNWQAYGDMLGPAGWVKKHHQGFDSVSGQLHKVYWNVDSYFAQNFDPQSQPYGFRTLARSIGEALLEPLPETDLYTLLGINRRHKLTDILTNRSPDPDMVACGIVPLVLFLVGSALAIAKWRRRSARLVLVWSGGVVVFLLFFSVMQQWHPFAFRYFVLVSPWMAIVGAWAIEQAGRPLRAIVWALVVALTLDVGWDITMRSNQSGWLTVAHPKAAPGYYLTAAWREWSQQLDHAEEPFKIALPDSRPIAAFYRQWPPREIVFIPEPSASVSTAEDFVREESGWVIVTANRFLGHEGNVAGSVWLFDGDETNGFSVAAYRRLEAGEKPEPLIYRLHRTQTKKSVTYELTVKTVSDQPVSLTLTNPAKIAYQYVWHTPLAQGKEIIAPGATTSFEPTLPLDSVGQLTVVFEPIDGAGSPAEWPTVKVFAIERSGK
jgi:hypothetical protein